jgi:hypothetical protein
LPAPSYLDTPASAPVDWREVKAILGGAYRHVAPKSLLSEIGRAANPKRT